MTFKSDPEDIYGKLNIIELLKARDQFKAQIIRIDEILKIRKKTELIGKKMITCCFGQQGSGKTLYL